jgi:DNA-binding XRE family transcriptional regulator
MQISSLGPAIRRYRKVVGLTQAELGERTGFDPKTISRFETGTYTPAWTHCSCLRMCWA